MKICMAGACGRMGRRILENAIAANDVEVAGALEAPARDGEVLELGAESGRPLKVSVSSDPAKALADADVLIDFTGPDACIENLKAAAEAGKAVVVGTTGLNVEQKQQVTAAAQRVPVVYAPNMSVGVNLLFKVAAEVASVLGLDYNVEIVETHHNQKKDSPSGTAVRLAESVAEALGLDYDQQTMHGREGMVGARPVEEIGMHALRGGSVAGDHTVHFLGANERLELTHRAISRDVFAQGALRAARFAVGAEPGLYDMQDVLGLK